VRVGMEATGYSRWFERLLAELGIEVWIGDAAEINVTGHNLFPRSCQISFLLHSRIPFSV
jgi:transposase